MPSSIPGLNPRLPDLTAANQIPAALPFGGSPARLKQAIDLARLWGCEKTLKTCTAALTLLAKQSSLTHVPEAIGRWEVAGQIIDSLRRYQGGNALSQTLQSLALSCKTLNHAAKAGQNVVRATGETLADKLQDAPNASTVIIQAPCTAQQMRQLLDASSLTTLIAPGLGDVFIEAFLNPNTPQDKALTLQTLNLNNSAISNLPDSLADRLPQLRTLSLFECGHLETLPDQWPAELDCLDLRGCHSLTHLPNADQLRTARLVDLRDCPSLRKLPGHLTNRLLDERAQTLGEPMRFAERTQTGAIRIAPRLAPPPMSTAQAMEHMSNRMMTGPLLQVLPDH
jgi:hypothetical protein